MDKNLIIFRKVENKDAKDWYILGNKVWRDAYSHIFPEEVFIEKEKQTPNKIKEFGEKKKNDNENITYVAEYNNEIIGIMCGSIKSFYNSFKSDYADLNAIYVDPRFQGLGIGSKFREIFENWAIENGASKYVIGVLEDNLKARKVYEAWGGQLSKDRDYYVRLGVKYPEVFYTYNILSKKK